MPYLYNEGRYDHMFDEPENTGNDIYLNDEISVQIERNLLTMATSRSGKGACQIIPNLLRWKHSALVIDPKGEAAEATAKAREAMGQEVHVLDPFETCKIPKRFRARLNLLDEIDPQSPHSFRQLNAIADGLIMRHSPEAGHWDGGAQEVLAGFMAHVLSNNSSRRDLIAMRQLLTEPDPEKFGTIIEAMGKNESCGRLPVTGAAKLTKTGTESGHFLSGAVSNSKWIDDPFMQTCLSDSTFKLSDLKRKPMTVFLVLPFDALADYGRFLRLFVRMALYHMMQKMPNGSLKGEHCLFILDEFYSLGNISEISKSIGGLPGANLHLWPFLQDYNQLIELYGKDIAGTFFANSDYSFFYGVDDTDTANFISKECGLITEADLGVPIPKKWQEHRPSQEYITSTTFFGLFNTRRETAEFYRYRVIHDLDGYDPPSSINTAERERRNNIRNEHKVFLTNKEAQYQDAMNQYAHAKATIGHARIQPYDVMEFTARHPTLKISQHAICLSKGQAKAFDLNAHFLKKESNDHEHN